MNSLMAIKDKVNAKIQAEYEADQRSRNELAARRKEMLETKIYPACIAFVANHEGVEKDDLAPYVTFNDVYYERPWQGEPENIVPEKIEGIIIIPDWPNVAISTFFTFEYDKKEQAPTGMGYTYGARRWNIAHYGTSCARATLGEALAEAEQYHLEAKAKEEEEVLENHNQKLAQIRYDNAKERHDAARQALMGELFKYPEAILLMRVFLKMLKDKEYFEEQLEDAYLASEEAAERHDRQMRRTADAAERELNKARHQADRLQWELDDAEVELRKAKNACRY